MSNRNGRKNIVIVGGGAGGAITARTLSKSLDTSKFNLILIDPRPNFILLPATVRLVVSKPEGIEDQVLVPLKDIFIKGRGTFIQDKVTGIEKNDKGRGGAVILSNNERVAFDALVLSPGSTWPSNFGFPDDPRQLRQYWADSRASIQAADDIVLVGGGAVGLELAGEINDTWPEKSVTIVQGDKHVLNKEYPLKFRTALESALASRKIKLVTNDYLENLEIDRGYVKTRNGKRIQADLVLTTRGPKPNTDFIAQSLGDHILASNGSLNVEPTLQLPNHPDIFAVGDVVNWPEQKQLLKAQAHGAIVAANVVAYLKGKSLKHYKGSPEVIVVMLGKTGGVGYMGFLWGFVLGDWFVRMMKSKSLMLGPLKGPYV